HWQRLKALHLNTVLAPVTWEAIEPEEGRFDFSSLDWLVEDARANDMRLVLLWFGSWKNSMSTYAPAWVKRDGRRFLRSTGRDGQPQDILSVFGKATRDADARAFAAMMKHLKAIDGGRHTVLMVQVENEIGFLPTAREHGPLADAAFAQ
uniref:beta-galactosidase n=3 Tax=Pseudomonadota TaxID=1224 RepID=UPI0019533F11